jgi:hypothetical protein
MNTKTFYMIKSSGHENGGDNNVTFSDQDIASSYGLAGVKNYQY